jgi:Xaa-Pro aminopeptidase
MRTSPRMQTENKFSTRRKKLLQRFKNDVAIISAAPERHLSRDQNYPFIQDSDFSYLTGFDETPSILILKNTSGIKSILYIKDRNPEEERWNGERLGIRRARRRFKIDDVRDINDFAKDFPELLQGTRNIHYAPGSNEYLDTLIWKYLSSKTAPQFERPACLKDIRLLTSEMRLIKDKDETGLLRRASEITAKGLKEIAGYIHEMKSEIHLAESLESLFAKHGGQGTAFRTIVASGKNATVLHHQPSFTPIWKRDLLLIDCGAKFKSYSGDITRVFPASGTFSSIQAEVYDAVHEAVQDALTKAKSGNCLDDIHQCAAKSLTRSLVEMKVLSGNPSHLFARGEYKPYFMHRTGHWLGIDVHDTAPAHFNKEPLPSFLLPLQSGMAFTIEPGLYFPHNDTSIHKELRGIGIRLEEDILITSKGHEILSKNMPIEREEIEKLFS